MHHQGFAGFELAQLVVHERAQMLLAKMAGDLDVTRAAIGASYSYHDGVATALGAGRSRLR
jgi:hypothetical protein